MKVHTVVICGYPRAETMPLPAVGMPRGNMPGIMDVDWIAVASASAYFISLLIRMAGLSEVKA